MSTTIEINMFPTHGESLAFTRRSVQQFVTCNVKLHHDEMVWVFGQTISKVSIVGKVGRARPTYGVLRDLTALSTPQ